jgi:hypothetical protein
VSQELDKRSLLAAILNYSQSVVYYGMAIALRATSGVSIVFVGTSLLTVFEEGP